MWYLVAVTSALVLAAAHKWGRARGGFYAFVFPVVAAAIAVSLMVVGDDMGDVTMRGAGSAMLIAWLVGLTVLDGWGSAQSQTHE